ncbi:MAG: UPF0182 family protein [Syntrophaceticus schinkii]
MENIPPQAEFSEIKVERPEIYYGELTDSIVVVNTKIGEFDYPSGEKNIYCSYQGKGGVQLTSFRRILYALHFKDMRLLLSSDITSESRILYQRTVQDASRLAPYLRFDSDPYPVVADGRIFWILRCLYSSQPLSLLGYEGGHQLYSQFGEGGCGCL